MSATPPAKKTAINPHNVWKPEDYFNIYLQPGMDKTPPENAGWAQGARKGPFVFISGLPQVTIPAGTADGAPVGLSFIGWRGGDEALLSLATAMAPLVGTAL